MDKYDKQIKKIKSGELNLSREWENGMGLFKFVGEDFDGYKIGMGCLTMIRSDQGYWAFTKGEIDKELTEEIKNDKRIPTDFQLIKDDLEVFAEWQRRIDLLNT